MYCVLTRYRNVIAFIISTILLVTVTFLQLPWLLPISLTLSPWIGFSSEQFGGMFIIHAVVAFFAVFAHRVYLHRTNQSASLPPAEDAQTVKEDKTGDFIDAASQFIVANYYVYGLQSCVALLLVSMLAHADVISVCYGVLVGIAVLTPRRHLAKGTSLFSTVRS